MMVKKKKYLTNRKMAETTDKFCLVELVGRHLHPSHQGHLLVHVKQAIFCDLDFEVRSLCLV